MTEIFSICTRVLHGMFGFDGLIYDAISHLAPEDFIPALRIIANDYHHVNQASVSAIWSHWLGQTLVPGECMRKFVAGVTKGSNVL